MIIQNPWFDPTWRDDLYEPSDERIWVQSAFKWKERVIDKVKGQTMHLTVGKRGKGRVQLSLLRTLSERKKSFVYCQ